MSNRRMTRFSRNSLASVIPDEVWLRILSYLSIEDICRMGATSRRYHRLFQDPTLWKELVFNWLNVKKNLKSINKVLERAIKVEKLKFTCTTDDTFPGFPDEKTMTSVVEWVKNTLKVLIFDDEIVPRNGAVVQFGCLSKLEVLDFPADKLGSSGVKAIAKLKNLRELKIPACEKVTHKDLSHLFHELKNLVVVDLNDCTAVTNGTIETLAKNNPNLEHLVLDNCDGLSPMWNNCKNLQYLSLEGCIKVGDSSIQKIAKNCPQLKHLNIGMCGVRDSGIKALAQNCPKLQYLDVFRCQFLSETVIEQAVVQWKDLEYISALGILYVSDQFLDKLRKRYPGLEIE